MKKSTEIRQDFLDFFASKEHRIVASASVVPYDDPTLLFTNAGMNQFKDVFLGTGKRDYKRCADTQKCIRVSGKHNDLEEVGHDGYHHTFFEMLGNWSFGDYYKKDAIAWAWELLTKVWGLDKNRLWVTVFRDDTEALELWKSETDIAHTHILKFDEKDNFWEMGDTGPCGPCSEIHYDFTPNGCKASDVNEGNPDVMEIWNLVFIQYNRDKEGVLHDLPAKHVDTGMGFERMVRVLQNKSSNYLTDVFLPLINELISITGKEYSGKHEASMNVIADHVRTLTFAIGDGAIPSNEGRGYVLRRVLRRAARYGRNLDMRTPFIYRLVDTLVDTMGHVFPEIVEKRELIKSLIKGEEESFNVTLDRGLKLFDDEIESMKNSGSKTFSGEVAFKLHDTFGFPVDLTQLMAREIGYDVDVNKFDELMNEQKIRAHDSRGSNEVTGEIFLEPPKFPISVKYDPYDLNENGIKTRLKFINLVTTKDKKMLFGGYTEINPFYSNSGGQVSDSGKMIFANGLQVEVVNSYPEHGVIIFENPYSKGNSTNESISGIDSTFYDEMKTIVEKEDEVTLLVDILRRKSIQSNHSATHLVHETLRRVLGSHIKQMGSYLDDKLLRFDFPHFHKLTNEEISNIEDIVNKKILEGVEVVTRTMQIDKAKKEYPNLRSFFGDKYGDVVRVVIIDKDFSVELCGGTHVKNTKDIGFFKIVKDESIAAGTRRIIAITGDVVKVHENTLIEDNRKKLEIIESNLNVIAQKSPQKVKQLESSISQYYDELANQERDSKKITFGESTALSSVLSATAATGENIAKIFVSFNEEKKQTEKELAKQKVQHASGSIDELLSGAKNYNGINVVTGKFDMDNADELKEIADKLREKLKSGVGLLYSIIDGKVSLVAVVSDDLIKEKRLSAGKIAGDFAKILGGGGGGKPHLATAGGKDVTKIDEAIAALPGIIQKYI